MSALLDRVRAVGGGRGLRGLPEALARKAFRATRPLLPATGPVRYAGLEIGTQTHLLDRLARPSWLREGEVSRPRYEDGLATGVRLHVRPGDRVVVVGGGWGIVAALAARLAGEAGTVDVFEASDAMLPRVRHTAAVNGVAERVRVHHALVAADRGVYGETSARTVAPEDLPTCDVLVLDCEGAERDILRAALGRAPRPRVAVVETHGFCGAPTALVRDLLREAGYRVTSEAIAETDFAVECLRLDVFVLLATDARADS